MRQYLWYALGMLLGGLGPAMAQKTLTLPAEGVLCVLALLWQTAFKRRRPHLIPVDMVDVRIEVEVGLGLLLTTVAPAPDLAVQIIRDLIQTL